jgi:hypothetical protein
MRHTLPLPIRFLDARSMVVSTIADARKALDGKWCNKEAASYKRAAHLLAAAQDGTCKPAVALAAFERAARDQGLLQAKDRSAGLRALDKLTTSLFTSRTDA